MTAADGFEAVFRDHASADRYAVRCHGIVEPLVKETEMRALIASLVFALAACGAIPNVDPASWPSRYEGYLTVLTKAYTATNLFTALGRIDKDQAAKVLREMKDVEDLAAAGLVLWGPVAGTEKLAADHVAARDALQSAIKAAGG